MLYYLAEPTKSESLNENVCAEIAALIKHDPLRVNSLDKDYQPIHWRRFAGRVVLFLGRDGAGKLVTVGCMSICPTLTDCVARIGEIIIDKDLRNASTERSILSRLTSWAGTMTDALSIELDDRLCAISEPVLREACFSRRHNSHHWRTIIP
jgi:hypothetical protein